MILMMVFISWIFNVFKFFVQKLFILTCLYHDFMIMEPRKCLGLLLMICILRTWYLRVSMHFSILKSVCTLESKTCHAIYCNTKSGYIKRKCNTSTPEVLCCIFLWYTQISISQILWICRNSILTFM